MIIKLQNNFNIRVGVIFFTRVNLTIIRAIYFYLSWCFNLIGY